MESSLKWPDYLILVSFLLISLAIGLYHSLTGGRQKTTEEFIMGNRRLKVLPTAISLLVSYQSAILVLGMTAEMYSYGPQMLLFDPFYFSISILVTERIFVPWMYRQKFVSVNEYCFVRFGSNSVKILASSLGIFYSVLYMGIAMYAPSAALESVTGLSFWISIPLMSMVCMAYTALGGMRAVIWTDVFQFLTMIAGMVAVIIMGVIEVGGPGNVIRYLKEEDRMNFVDWSPDPTVRHTLWGLFIGGTMAWTPVYSLSQAAVQRYSAMPSINKARQTLLLSIPGTILVEVIASIVGFVVVAYYAKIQCDPLRNKEINNENQVLPHFVISVFNDAPGFAGLFLATLYGGALSSVSSGLSGSAANCWEDILKGKLSHLRETTKAIINRILVILFGLLATTISFLAATLPGPVTQIEAALCGAVTGPLFGIFLLGGISRLPNWKGALGGGVVGFIVNLWLGIGSMSVSNQYPSLPPLSIDGCSKNETSLIPLCDDNCTYSAFSSRVTSETQLFTEHSGIDRFYCLSYLWYVSFGVLVTLSVGFVLSLITRDKETEKAIEDKLLMRFRDICSSCFGDEEEEEIKPWNDTQDSEDVDLKKSLRETTDSTI